MSQKIIADKKLSVFKEKFERSIDKGYSCVFLETKKKFGNKDIEYIMAVMEK